MTVLLQVGTLKRMFRITPRCQGTKKTVKVSVLATSLVGVEA